MLSPSCQGMMTSAYLLVLLVCKVYECVGGGGGRARTTSCRVGSGQTLTLEVHVGAAEWYGYMLGNTLFDWPKTEAAGHLIVPCQHKHAHPRAHPHTNTPPAWRHKLVKGGLDKALILLQNVHHIPATLSHITLDSTHQPRVVICIAAADINEGVWGGGGVERQVPPAVAAGHMSAVKTTRTHVHVFSAGLTQLCHTTTKAVHGNNKRSHMRDTSSDTCTSPTTHPRPNLHSPARSGFPLTRVDVHLHVELLPQLRHVQHQYALNNNHISGVNLMGRCDKDTNKREARTRTHKSVVGSAVR